MGRELPNQNKEVPVLGLDDRAIHYILFYIEVTLSSVTVVFLANTILYDIRAAVLSLYSVFQLTLVFIFLIWKKTKNIKTIYSWFASHQQITGVDIICSIILLVGCMAATLFFLNTREVAATSIVTLFAYHFFLIALPEEAVFRGIAFDGFKLRPTHGLFFSAFLFAFCHINNGAQWLPYYAALGLMFGVLRWTGFSILWLAICHAIWNVSMTLLADGTFRFSASIFFTLVPLLIITASLLLGPVRRQLK